MTKIRTHANCARCRAHTLIEDALWDNYIENYFCDKECFFEWADEHFEEVAEYYFKFNIEY